MPTTNRSDATDGTDDRPVACSLSEDAALERLKWVAEALGEDVRDHTVESDRLTWTFDRTDDAIEGVTTLAAREAACCGFATIEVTIPPAAPITFEMDVPEGAGERLLEQFADVADPRDVV